MKTIVGLQKLLLLRGICGPCYKCFTIISYDYKWSQYNKLDHFSEMEKIVYYTETVSFKQEIFNLLLKDW